MTTAMLLGHEFYVGVGGPNGGIDRVRAAVGDGSAVHAEAASTYCVVMWAKEDFRPPEHLLETLSRELSTVVLWLAWQKQADAFAFQRWVGGVRVRCLSYGIERERVWEAAQGTPEPWEVEALFPPSRLERQLKVRRLFPDPDGLPESELHRLWQEQVLAVGSVHPRLAAIDAAWVVARYYRLPGWDL